MIQVVVVGRWRNGVSLSCCVSRYMARLLRKSARRSSASTAAARRGGRRGGEGVTGVGWWCRAGDEEEPVGMGKLVDDGVGGADTRRASIPRLPDCQTPRSFKPRRALQSLLQVPRYRPNGSHYVSLGSTNA